MKTLIINLINKNIWAFTFISFLLLTLFIFNQKTLLAVFFIFFVILYFVFKKNLFETCIITLFLSIPFENFLRFWVFFQPYANELQNYKNYAPATSYFGINLKIVLSIVAICLFFLSKHDYLTKIKSHLSFKLLILFYIASIISSVFAPFYNSVTFFGLLRLTTSIIIFIMSYIFFSANKNKNIFFGLIIAITFFTTFVALIQLVKQQPAGFFIELTSNDGAASPTSYTTDGAKQYRIASILPHPVFFGSFICLLLPITIGIYLQKKHDSLFDNLFLFILIFASIAATIGSLSRSTWINLLVIFFLFYLINPKNLYYNFQKIPKKIIKIVLGTCLLSSIPLIFILAPRLGSIANLKNYKGSFDIRRELFMDGIRLTQFYPLTGTGINNFTTDLILENHNSGQVGQVHNTIGIIVSELGVPVGLIFILFLINILAKPDPKNIFQYSIWISLVTFLISSQFHPLLNQDPTFDLFMFISAYYASQKTTSA